MKEYKIRTATSSWNDLAQSILGTSIVSYQISEKQDLGSCWKLYLNTNKNICIEVFSEVNTTDDWNEFGVLVVNVVELKEIRDSFVEKKLSQPFQIASIRVLTFEDDDYTTECGIQIVDENEAMIKITSSPAPGAVSIEADFNHGEYRPEFLEKHCQVTSVYNL